MVENIKAVDIAPSPEWLAVRLAHALKRGDDKTASAIEAVAELALTDAQYDQMLATSDALVEKVATP